jgi:hypothetical protein
MTALALLFASLGANAQALSNQQQPLLSEGTAQANDKPPAAPELSEVRVGFFQRYSELRRGRDQEIGVFLCRPTLRLPDCVLHFENQPLPVLLEMEPAQGFTIRYGDGRHYKSEQPGKPYNLADRRVVFLKLHASSKVPPGEYTLKGTVTFRTSRMAVASGPERLPVEIRVTVVNHDTTVALLEWPYGSNPGRAFKNAMTGFVAAPYWTGELVYAAAYCTVTGCK